MTAAAPTTLSYLILKQRHLKAKIAHRRSATYFHAPLDLQRELNRINARIALHQETVPSTNYVES